MQTGAFFSCYNWSRFDSVLYSWMFSVVDLIQHKKSLRKVTDLQNIQSVSLVELIGYIDCKLDLKTICKYIALKSMLQL